MDLRRISTSPHLRAVGYLASGSAVAQGVGVVTTPIITRMYSPSDYGVVALYGAIVAIAASVAGGRYETAVSLPSETAEGERDAIALVHVAFAIALGMSGVALVCVILITMLGGLGWLAGLGWWAYAIPIGILTTTWSATLSSYATRRREYSIIARIPPMQRLVSAGVQLSFGAVRAGLAGLMAGAVISPLVGLGVLFRVYREGRAACHAEGSPWEWVTIRAVAKRFSDFPRVSTWFALLNALAWNVQAIILARYYSIYDIGQYALAAAMITLPTSLVLAGVSQVYLREAAARVADSAAVVRVARQTLKALMLTSLPLFLLLFIAGKYLFTLIFGPGWETAGAIAVAMIPLAWARFLTTSLTATFTVYRRQGRLLVWQMIALGVTVAALGLGGASGLPVATTTLVASLAAAPLYLILLPMVFRLIRSGV